ncbi:uncharacterized protein AtWU_05853 [Aspergillus tubingensis]|uniref:Uncharacterized protein n=1 Tax=Aspergillus tubingensis (strain CBS 134.48) TaxID=767770 RepID=A0A1L9NB46_ASPTC|nr:uncharacterized protein AtWU_05853 [Aspergillus tubingensis]OJI86471.1 hypothetical protein ASPTUDRAFT_39370 [Aspergillus tubingensis CBS 134.48]GFN16052.1 hypothetical protein AtWU_05853 [Aspergillus tubingensis]
MRLFTPITLLVTTIAPALAAVDAGQDSDHICNANEECRYTTDYPMEDFKPPAKECTCPTGSECTFEKDDMWNSAIQIYSCQ